jgi:regulator of sigma E protease
VKAIPFGGFLAMAGEYSKELTGKPDEYLSLKWFKKMWISFAGPFFNYILAVLIFAAVFNIWGASEISKSSAIGEVLENYPAAKAGLISGDKIAKIGKIEINSWNDLILNLKDKADKETKFLIERGTSSFSISMVVAENPVTKAGAIGITPEIITTKTAFFYSFWLASKASINQTVMTLAYLADKIISWEKPDIAGPIGVMQVMAKASKSGMKDYLRLLAVISVALGLFNLLPIPMVDGGMIVLFAVEGIIRKRIGERIVQIYNTIGLIFIIAIFIFATYGDLLRLGIFKLFGK